MSVRSFLDAVEAEIGALHSFVLLRDGEVVAEGAWHPYRLDRPHRLFSLSKSFTSTAVGLAVAEGRLSLDDPIATFFPAADRLPLIRVRHLLTMTTGHAAETGAAMAAGSGGDWVGGFLRLPVEHEPGTHFVYNSGATYLLSAILQARTGQTLLDYLRPRLFEPLALGPAAWETCPRGISTGGWGLSLSVRDIARFGQLYLQEGVWEGRRLLPEGWTTEASALHIANGDDAASDWAQGYGYQFWRCRHAAYRADGAFGQFCVVMPDRSAVLAVTAGVPDMQAVLNLAWTHLLPTLPRTAPAPPESAPREPATTALGAGQFDHVQLGHVQLDHGPPTETAPRESAMAPASRAQAGRSSPAGVSLDPAPAHKAAEGHGRVLAGPAAPRGGELPRRVGDDPALWARLAALRLPALGDVVAAPAGFVPGEIFVVAEPHRPRPGDWLPSHETAPTIRSVAFGRGPGDGGGWVVTLVDRDGSREHACVGGGGGWHEDGDVASTGGWTAPGVFTLRVAFTNGPFIRTFTFARDGDGLVVAARDNLSFGAVEHASVRAVRAAADRREV